MTRTGLGIMAAALVAALVACGGGTVGGDAGGGDGLGDLNPADLGGEATDVPAPDADTGGRDDVPTLADDGVVVPDLPDDGATDPAMPDDGVTPPDADADADIDDADADGDVPDVADPGEDGETPSDLDVEEVEACEGAWCTPCPDPLPCARYVRDPEGNCKPVVADGFCLVLGECWFTLQPSPNAQCLFCDPTLDKYGFSPHAGLPCDDADGCTMGDTCDAAGVCVGDLPTNCDDDNVCTVDSCVPGLTGCVHTPIPASQQKVCDDGSLCTYNDHCDQGVCTGYALSCEDADPCTDRFCDPTVGCVTNLNQAPCNDQDACTENDQCFQGKCKGTAITCDDGDPCTKDECVFGPLGGCRSYPNPGGFCDDGNPCTIKDNCGGDHPGVCRGDPVECDDGNLCTKDFCDPVAGCVYLPNSLPCDDGNPCTQDREPDPSGAPLDTCKDGVCQGAPRVCNDNDNCTRDVCNASLGRCQFIPLGPTEYCEDGDACTIHETCASGTCEGGQALDCDDRNDCTADSCGALVGCIHTPAPGLCQPSDPCAKFSTGKCENGVCVANEVRDCDDGNPCTRDSCDEFGECTHTAFSGPCEDGNACTTGESCSAQGVCGGGTAVGCDDDNACTFDTCDPKMGCVHTTNPGAVACTDHSACTMNDRCKDGVCIGIETVCDDGNFCTDDGCDPAVGCFFKPSTRPCDDANVCTINDTCAAGACVGQSLFTDPAAKAGKLSFGISGNPGQGVNIDANESTCAPKGSCVQGIDNAFGQLAWLFNPELTKAVASGAFGMMFENHDFNMTPAPYHMNLFYGVRVAPTSCDPATAGCNYRILPLTLTPSCGPIYGFDNAKITGTKLTAGGTAYQAPFYLVMGENQIPLILRWARVEATVSLSGGKVTSGTGALGGALPRQEILDAVGGIPAEKFPPPYTRDIVLQYLNLYLKPDIDLDGDGTKESISVGLPFTLVTGHIIGPL